jgi:hypothetical protein
MPRGLGEGCIGRAHVEHDFIGGPDTIRTCDLRLRRATLYPTELRVRAHVIARFLAPRKSNACQENNTVCAPRHGIRPDGPIGMGVAQSAAWPTYRAWPGHRAWQGHRAWPTPSVADAGRSRHTAHGEHIARGRSGPSRTLSPGRVGHSATRAASGDGHAAVSACYIERPPNGTCLLPIGSAASATGHAIHAEMTAAATTPPALRSNAVAPAGKIQVQNYGIIGRPAPSVSRGRSAWHQATDIPEEINCRSRAAPAGPLTASRQVASATR